MQGAALGLILIGCLFAPRPGGTVVLIPLVHRPIATRTIAEPVAILRAGTIPGSLLVRIGGTVPVLALLRRGVLALAAPSNICATVAPDLLQRKTHHG